MDEYSGSDSNEWEWDSPSPFDWTWDDIEIDVIHTYAPTFNEGQSSRPRPFESESQTFVDDSSEDYQIQNTINNFEDSNVIDLSIPTFDDNTTINTFTDVDPND